MSLVFLAHNAWAEHELGAYSADHSVATESEIVEFLLALREVPYSRLVPPGTPAGTPVSFARKRAAVAKDLATLEKSFGRKPPYSILETELILAGQTDAARRVAEERRGQREKSEPELQIRSTADDIGPKAKATGATLSFLKDNVTGQEQERWSTKGSLIYQTKWHLEEAERGSFFATTTQWIGPAISWDVIDTSLATGKGEIDDFQFSFPYKFYGITSRTEEGLGVPRKLRSVELMLKPYYHTDFSFDGVTVGATASIEPTLKFNDRLALGTYHAAFPESKNSWVANLAYRMRIAPELSFDNVVDGGDHTTRDEGDGWLRAGSLAELSIRPFGEEVPFELSAAYKFFFGLSGDDKWSDLFKVSATYWIIKDTYGIRASFEEGETPVSDKSVDNVTLGLEVKF